MASGLDFGLRWLAIISLPYPEPAVAYLLGNDKVGLDLHRLLLSE